MRVKADIRVESLSHVYGEQMALRELNFRVQSGDFFALVGPNGGGKSTLFKLLSTLIPIQKGRVEILGMDLASCAVEVRSKLGVVFQSPALDKVLTVSENLKFQGQLYGVWGKRLATRIQELLELFALSDRKNDRIQHLSGGLKRRVEIAKGVLHHPKILMLDEPTAGLDPWIRQEVWGYLERLRKQTGITIVASTHLLDEAKEASWLALLCEGQLIAEGEPGQLCAQVGSHVIRIESLAAQDLGADIRAQLGVDLKVLDQEIHIGQGATEGLLSKIANQFGNRFQTISLGRPTLHDFFIQKLSERIGKAFLSSLENT